MAQRAGRWGCAVLSASPHSATAAVTGPTTAGESPFWFDRPAEHWLEALPVGNGHIAAMCFGRPGVDRLQINDQTAWSGSPRSEAAGGLVSADVARRELAAAREALDRADHGAAERRLKRLQQRYTQAYLPFVDLELGVLAGGRQVRTGSAGGYRRRLDLGQAVAVHRYTVDGYTLTHTVFASRPAGVLVIDVASDHPDEIQLVPALTTPLRSLGGTERADVAGLLVQLPSDVAPTHEDVEVPVAYSDEPGAALRGAAAMITRGRPGGATLYLATATTFTAIGSPPEGDEHDCFEQAAARVRAAAARDLGELRAEHVAAHRALYDRVVLELGPAGAKTPTRRPIERRLQDPDAWRSEPDLVGLLFQYGRYLLISSSRPGGLPANLQGIWNAAMQPPWSSNYTLNINTEMNYWPAGVTALAECHEPLIDLVEALAEAGRETARRLYGAGGWVAHHNSDAWAYTSPVGMGRGDPAWAHWPMAGPWLCRSLWDAYQFSGEPALLRRIWPLLCGAAEFLVDWLVETPDGARATSPSVSPENHFVAEDGEPRAVATSSAMDMALCRDLFEIVSAAADTLGEDTDLVHTVRRLADRLPGPAVGARGEILEWETERVEYEPAHRHVSHLYAAYPGTASLSDEQLAAVGRSLDLRGADSTGWSLAWKLALRARLGQGSHVSELISLAFRPVPAVPGAARGQFAGGLYPNLFSAHPPFQIDGNLGFTGALAECLVQSHTGRIVLLPALPPELAEGRVSGLRTRQAVRVDLEWSGGRLRRAGLRAPAETEVELVYGDACTRLTLPAGTVVEYVP
ncbi:glycosyl hydrolase family 95 catalytic domain-containing protein [Phytoactinopolyspora halotolerans]|uniref:Uncharacterized protein n=1 Tax=Phytoactinopolyspora halotolerans TaxID=1981512 RepID=A0A6L9S1E8_9ACTN|nr:glycoside hydrolase N-terminal domain-containing protein [Phytoactinopolyspora halotolerans]NED98816.1 hypothetical protein [Phytoactinopolyspora halotolerans]